MATGSDMTCIIILYCGEAMGKCCSCFFKSATRPDAPYVEEDDFAETQSYQLQEEDRQCLPRDWKQLGECQKVIQHNPGKRLDLYYAVAVNSEGLLAVTGYKCIYLFTTKNGNHLRSIGQGVYDGPLYGVAFDRRGNIWVSDSNGNKVVQMSQDGSVLQTIRHAARESDYFDQPFGVSVSPEGLVYIYDSGNGRITVHDESGAFLFDFGAERGGPKRFGMRDITFGSDGLMYVTDLGNFIVNVWSKEGNFVRCIKTRYTPTCIAVTSDDYLLITSYPSHTVMVYTLEGDLIHEFGEKGTELGKFREARGICVDDRGRVFVCDCWTGRVQVF